MTSHTLASLQAKRAQHAPPVGEYQQRPHLFLAELHPDDSELHTQVVLPGARRAITASELTGLQRSLSIAEIVERVNGRWDAANGTRDAQTREWIDGEYRTRVDRHRRRQQARLQALAEAQARLAQGGD